MLAHRNILCFGSVKKHNDISENIGNILFISKTVLIGRLKLKIRSIALHQQKNRIRSEKCPDFFSFLLDYKNFNQEVARHRKGLNSDV